MKNFNDTIGNGTRDLPACSAVRQPTAPPAACPTRQSTRFTYNSTCLLGAFTEVRKATVSFFLSVCLSVRPHGTARLPPDGFL